MSAASRRLPRTVIVLGSVSFLADVASDMVDPLVPLYLTATLGAGPAVVGLIEGLADSAAALLRLVSGRLADRGVSAKGLALLGYGLSGALRPLLAVAGSWPVVLVLRFGNRVGKGIRTAPRDAILSASVGPDERGRAFGLHRSMDHLGATLGPLIATGLLALGLTMPHVFVATLVPAAAAVLVLGLGVTREQGRLASRAGGGALPPLSWSALHPSLRRLVLAAGGLTLASVPDAFFAIWLCAHGVKPTWVPAAWAGGCAVRALVAWPAGHLSDLRGRLPVMVLAWTARAVLLAALPWIASLPVAVAAYLVYCATTASTEGAERALVGDAASPREKGTAFGLYYLVVGLVALPGAWVFGLLWQRVSEHAAFTASAALTLLCALLFAWTARAERTGGGEAALPS